ncbi:Hypothetical protein NGAL_HAMBI2605_56380 [Neorhizobium galegae bv. orientalis]|nr:Hypothetical protein NGAL_HAMBI2605_56380 [Neorhizobium galegae bv. orientalis]
MRLGWVLLSFSMFSTPVVLLATSAAACIASAELKKLDPNTNSYIHETKRSPNISVSVYRKGQSFVDFIEVFREGSCITVIQQLNHEQFTARYLDTPEQWIAEEEGKDNEGMGEGEEGAALADEQKFPFLFHSNFSSGKIYDGPRALPDFKGRDREFYSFRTRISEGMKKGPNFAGEFAIVQIGCGTSCSFAVVGNVRTGQVFQFPRGGEDVGPLTLKFTINSSLMIATWRDGERCVLESSQFNGEKWASLAKPAIGSADRCYEDIDQNVSAYIRSENNPEAIGFPAAGKETYKAEERSDETSLNKPRANRPPDIADDTYEDINLTALLKLYELYNYVSACHHAGRDVTFPYLNQSEMKGAELALKSAEDEILRRNPSLNRATVKQRAWELSKYTTSLVLASGIKPTHQMAKVCQDIFAMFPPNPDKTVRVKKSNIHNKPNTGGGLIKPQTDPRFNRQ